ncbi:unnamed protein product [Rodentolepis nana]|uniref:Uncharacterized protein n=1 Tax=Rodentolepis nana TaxID=102285 RepID=A0A0R3TB39_RODNA|nr:unnamed protein product [Rodentolepis nana]
MNQNEYSTMTGNSGVETGRTRVPVRLHRRQTTLDSMPPPVIGPDGFPIFKEPPHADAPDVGMQVQHELGHAGDGTTSSAFEGDGDGIKCLDIHSENLSIVQIIQKL